MLPLVVEVVTGVKVHLLEARQEVPEEVGWLVFEELDGFDCFFEGLLSDLSFE